MSSVSFAAGSERGFEQATGCVLHIGMPKTATTTLQGFLFPKHSQVEFLGRGYPAEGPMPAHRHPSDAAFALLSELVYENWRSPDWARCRELTAQLLEPARELGKTPVFSWESLVEDRMHVRRARAENFREAFGPCSVIITLRHPVKLVESLYLQMIRRDNWGGTVRRGDRPRYETIDRWLTKNWGTPGQPPSSHLEYPETIEAYAEVFGRENIHILLFEDFVESPDRFIRHLCEILGIDAEEGVRLTSGKKLNDRVTAEQLARLEHVCRSPFRRLWFRYLSPKARREYLGAPAKLGDCSVGTPARPTASPEWTARIEDAVREGNNRLRAAWNLDLERHGYPL